MNIKVIGVDNKNGIKILNILSKIEKELHLKFNILKVASSNRDKYGIRQVPALIINDDVVMKGCVMTSDEIKSIIQEKMLMCNN